MSTVMPVWDKADSLEAVTKRGCGADRPASPGRADAGGSPATTRFNNATTSKCNNANKQTVDSQFQAKAESEW